MYMEEACIGSIGKATVEKWSKCFEHDEKCLGKCPKPKTLNDLWHEYIFGLTGNKPAKDLTRAERGKVRFTSARRLVFWERCSEMIRMGYRTERAIDKIYTAYGNCGSSVTKIINTMMQDRKNKIVREGLREVALKYISKG